MRHVYLPESGLFSRILAMKAGERRGVMSFVPELRTKVSGEDVDAFDAAISVLGEKYAKIEKLEREGILFWLREGSDGWVTHSFHVVARLVREYFPDWETFTEKNNGVGFEIVDLGDDFFGLREKYREEDRAKSFSDEEISFFVERIKRLPARKTEKPGTEYESWSAKAKCSISPGRDAIIVDWGYYHVAIDLLKSAKECDECGIPRDCRYRIWAEHPGVINDCVGTIFSSGGYVTRESCWRGFVARTRRVIL